MAEITVAAVQMNCGRDVQENIQHADSLVRSAAEKGAQIILLPELFERQYFCQERRYEYYAFAKPVSENDAVQHFIKLAKELQAVLPISFYERDGNVLYNSVAVIDADGSLLGVYRKTHIPDDHYYQEKFYFTPGDMGFDVVHLNLHKTFATPHGGGGPGSGPSGCKAFLAPFLPGTRTDETKEGTFTEVRGTESVGDVRSERGNFLVIVKAYAYLLSLGREGVPHTAESAVLDANYMMAKLKPYYPMAYDTICMHEFVMTLEKMKHEIGVSALDVAKALLDEGIHPPTMYFPLIVHEALMVEPTESETKETLDAAVDALIRIHDEAYRDPEKMHGMPYHTPVRRLDEVKAARTPVIRYDFGNA